jgi:murein DD-endopeptidase MepM/ murein hydrolase activator NlpD
MSGRVIFSEDKVRGFGKTVIIDHGDGIQTVYSHNSEILVKIGEDVRQGKPVAKVGSGGRGNSPYLHFEIRKRHKPQNPFYYLS